MDIFLDNPPSHVCSIGEASNQNNFLLLSKIPFLAGTGEGAQLNAVFGGPPLGDLTG